MTWLLLKCVRFLVLGIEGEVRDVGEINCVWVICVCIYEYAPSKTNEDCPWVFPLVSAPSSALALCVLCVCVCAFDTLLLLSSLKRCTDAYWQLFSSSYPLASEASVPSCLFSPLVSEAAAAAAAALAAAGVAALEYFLTRA